MITLSVEKQFSSCLQAFRAPIRFHLRYEPCLAITISLDEMLQKKTITKSFLRQHFSDHEHFTKLLHRITKFNQQSKHVIIFDMLTFVPERDTWLSYTPQLISLFFSVFYRSKKGCSNLQIHSHSITIKSVYLSVRIWVVRPWPRIFDYGYRDLVYDVVGRPCVV